MKRTVLAAALFCAAVAYGCPAFADGPMLDQVLNYIRATHEAEKDFHHSRVKELNVEKSNLEGKLDRLTDLLVDGHINEDVYKQKHKELAKRILDITDEAKDNTEGNLKFKEALSNIVCLLSNSRNLFESSHVEEKRKLLGFVFENLELEGSTLRFSLRKPFELLAGLPNNPEWRPLLVAIRTHFREDVLNLHKILPPTVG